MTIFIAQIATHAKDVGPRSDIISKIGGPRVQ